MLWLSHRRIFTYFKSADSELLLLNLVLMFFVVLVPFAMRVLNYGYLRPALDVFALIEIGAFVLSSIIWRYGSSPNRHLLRSNVSPKIDNWFSNQGFITAGIFVLSIFLAYVNPYLTLTCWLLTFPINNILHRRFTKNA